MLRRRHLSTGELQEVYVAIGAARTDILSRKVSESGEAVRRAMLRVIENMEGWMRMVCEAQLGLVKCWTTLERLESELGCARRYLEKSEIASWQRDRMSMKEFWELARRHQRSEETRGEARSTVARLRAREEEENAGPGEESIRRAMQVVGWTLEEWLVRSETADSALTMCREAYDELEQDLVAVRQNPAGSGRRRRTAAGADVRKTASSRGKSARRSAGQVNPSAGGSRT
jgi:hypothetical protein